MYEMLKGIMSEGRQLDDDSGGQTAGTERKVVTPEGWRAAESGRDVPDCREVTHLLDSDAENRGSPTLDSLRLLDGQPPVVASFQTEGGVEIGAHQIVFELRGFAESKE